MIFAEFLVKNSNPVNICWLVGCFGLNGPLRQYFSLYRAVSQKEGEREIIDESKNVQPTPTRIHCKCSRPLPTLIQTNRTPRYWKFTQHHCTTRPPLLPWKRARKNRDSHSSFFSFSIKTNTLRKFHENP